MENAATTTTELYRRLQEARGGLSVARAQNDNYAIGYYSREVADLERLVERSRAADVERSTPKAAPGPAAPDMDAYPPGAVRAVLIDAEAETLTDVVISDPENIAEYYRLIGNGCDIVEQVQIAPDRFHRAFIDEMGMLKGPQHFFRSKVYGDWLAGNGLVTGMTADGYTASCRIEAAEMAKMIEFLHREEPLDESEIPQPVMLTFDTHEEWEAHLQGKGDPSDYSKVNDARDQMRSAIERGAKTKES